MERLLVSFLLVLLAIPSTLAYEPELLDIRKQEETVFSKTKGDTPWPEADS